MPERSEPAISGPVGFHVDPGLKGHVEIRDSTVIGAKVGIALPEGANVTMSGNKFVDVETPVKFYKK